MDLSKVDKNVIRDLLGDAFPKKRSGETYNEISTGFPATPQLKKVYEDNGIEELHFN
jgi:hypothetical protein